MVVRDKSGNAATLHVDQETRDFEEIDCQDGKRVAESGFF